MGIPHMLDAAHRDKVIARYLLAAGQVDADTLERLETIVLLRSQSGQPTPLAGLLADEGIVEPERARALEEDTDLERLGDYEVVDLLGVGGMAVVYRAWRKGDPDGRSVALKVVRPHAHTGAEAAARFEREIGIWRDLDHPNIVRVRDAGEADGRLFLAMDCVDGGDLMSRVMASGPLSPSESHARVCDVLRALEYAHEHDVVHRDVKPQNILLGERALLTDFGLARWSRDFQGALTRTGLGMGTPGFVAPEQLQDAKRVDARADLFSLGATWLVLMLGRDAIAPLAAFGGQALVESRLGHVDPAWRRVLSSLLQNDPGRRPRSARDVLSALASE